MMDIGISGAAGADAAYGSNAVRSNARSDDADSKGGFLDVLSKAKDEGTKLDGNDDASAPASDPAGLESGVHGAGGKRSGHGPLIDIQNTGRVVETPDHLADQALDKTIAKSAKDNGKPVKERSRTGSHTDDTKADDKDGKSLATLIGV